MSHQQSTFLHIRCRPAIKAALETVADDQMITPSAYARRALVRSLQADGAIAAPAMARRSKPTSEAEFA